MSANIQGLLLREYPHPLLFTTVTGSRAFGCAGPDSDYDIHGVHVLSLHTVLGLGHPDETLERKIQYPGIEEMDVTTHDLKKFVWLLLKGNGNVLEDLYSPLVVTSSPAHEELKRLGEGCITKRLAHHYKGMAYTQQRRMKVNELKKYLHTYRCLLMGIHLMRSGQLVMDLPTLANEYHHTQIHDLIALKLQGFDFVPNDNLAHARHIGALTVQLEQAREESNLPEAPTAATRDQLEHLVIQVRLEAK